LRCRYVQSPRLTHFSFCPRYESCHLFGGRETRYWRSPRNHVGTGDVDMFAQAFMGGGPKNGSFTLNSGSKLTHLNEEPRPKDRRHDYHRTYKGHGSSECHWHSWSKSQRNCWLLALCICPVQGLKRIPGQAVREYDGLCIS